MSNLLEKASIITTPTAYDNGKILSVKPAPSLGSELVTNGDFATDSNWNRIGTWSISSGQASANANSQSQYLQQDFSITNSKVYKFTYEIIENTLNGNGASLSSLGGFGSVPLSNVIGYHTEYITASNQSATYALKIGVSGTATSGKITIDNVSVKEVTDADFDFTRGSSATRVNEQGLVEDVQILSSNLVQNGDFSQEGSELITNGGFDTDTDWVTNDWNISGGSLNGSASTGIVFQNNLGVVVGKTYKVVLEISNYTSGLIRFKVGGASYQNIASENGVQEFYFVAATSDNNILFSVQSAYTGSIDNVSVKEVGQDWTLGTGWSIGDSKAISDATQGYISQTNVGAAGVTATYKVQWTQNITAGARLRFFARNYNDTGNETILSGSTTGEGSFGLNGNSVGSGTFTAFVSSTNGYSFKILAEAGVEADISNISVIEITEDTNLPRIDYTGGTGHWLFEPQRTNLVTYSEDLSQWSSANGSVSTDLIINPTGNTNQSFFIPNTLNNFHHIDRATSITSGTEYTISIFLKADGSDFLNFVMLNTTSGNANGNSGPLVNIKNGTKVGFLNTDYDVDIVSYGNGWYRYSWNVTTNASVLKLDVNALPSSSISTYNGNGINGIYVWGLQIEEGYETSYIPTNGSTVTRLQDAAFGAGSSDLINSTEGVLYAEIATLANFGTRAITLSSGSNNDAVLISFNSNGRLDVNLTSGGSFQAIFNYTGVANPNTFNKIAFKYKQDDFSLFVNGVKVATDTNGLTPIGLNVLNFAKANSAQDNFFGKTKCVAVFKEALTDAELTCLTTI